MISEAEYSRKNAELEAENSRLKSGNIQLAARVEELAAQVKWFQNQLFGQKSERRIDEPSKEHYGGVVAAPAFRKIAYKTLNYLNIPPENKTDKLIASLENEA